MSDTVYDPSLSPSAQEQTARGYLSTASLAAAGAKATLDQIKIQVADPGQLTPTRDRAVVVAVADELGALLLGLGAGHMQAEYEQIGLAFDRAATRVERLAESVPIIKALLRGESVALHGSHYQLRDHRIYPLPVQRPHPPLLVGGNGRQILGLAAREAQTIGLMGFGHRRGGREINPSGFTEAATRTRIEWLREAAPERFADLELNVLVQRVIVTDHPQREADALAKPSSWGSIG